MNRVVKDADANEGFEDSYDPAQTKLKQRQKKLRQQKSVSIKVHQLHIVELVIVFVSTHLVTQLNFHTANYESLATVLQDLCV